MSANAVSPSEAEITQVLHNLLSTQYALDEEDQKRVFRLIQYGNEKKGLTDEEKKILIERGLMDKTDERLMPPEEFIFRGTVTPAFWLKCLLALDGLIDFSGKIGETPSQ
jgi:hypothetical protein